MADGELRPGFRGCVPGILSLDGPEDFVVASGERHTVRESVEDAFVRS